MVIILNKPYGVLSQFNENPDYPEQRTLKELELPPQLMPVGRLDMDSEGLLLLTDEKGFENALLNPKKEHKRCYLVQVHGVPNSEALEQLRAGGLQIRGHSTKPCQVDLLEGEPMLEERVPPVDTTSVKQYTWLRMELTEGKNRQVRRMTAKVGHPTLRLVRESIGDVRAPDLKVGEWRVLSESECEALFVR